MIADIDERTLLITFVAILIGLGLRDLFFFLNRILRYRKQIKWHWIPMVHAFVAFMSMIITWYSIDLHLNSPLVSTSLGFFIWLIPILILLLIMLAVLPDKIPENQLDLLAWYFNQRTYYFVILELYLLTLTINRFLAYETMQWWFAPLVLFILFLPLVFTKSYWYHAVGAVLLVTFFLLNFYGQITGIL